MKILFISKYAATFETDVPSRQFFFAKELARRGHEVMLVNSRSNGVPQMKRRKRPALSLTEGGKVEKSKIANLEILTLDGPVISLGMNWKRIWSWVWFEIQLLRNYSNFRAFAPDIVLVSSLSFLSFWNGIRIKKKFKIPLAIEIRDLYPLTLMEVGDISRINPVVLVMGWLEKKAYREADVIISSLENAIEHVEKIGGVQNFLWLPMGWEESMYEHEGSASIGPHFRGDDTWKSIIGDVRALKDEGKFVVGYAGTMGRANALGELLSLVGDEDLLAAGVYFVMIGGGPKAEDYQREFGGENIRFYPAVAKKYLPTVLSECDLLFNGWLKRNIYRFGISPNKWIDYMYAGRPVLLALSANSAIFKEANFGWQIEAESRQDLKDSLLGISGLSREELGQKGMKGRLYLQEKLNYKDLAIKLEKKLQAVVDGE